MKILVTGGGGFLGQALCRGLVERGHQVVSFNRGHYPVPVSYTHLDVYKRQAWCIAIAISLPRSNCCAKPSACSPAVWTCPPSRRSRCV